MLIYKIENLVNNKIYIGLTRGALEVRWKSHLASARAQHKKKSALHSAIGKYGKENFSMEVIDDSAKTIEELINLEKQYIKEYDSFISGGKGYNMTFGGDGVLGQGRIAVIKVDIESGEIVDEYESLKDAVSKNKRGVDLVYYNLDNKRTCNGHCFYKKSYVESWEQDDFMMNLAARYNLVCQLDLEGNLIKYWSGQNRAANELGLSQGNLHSCLSGKRNQAGGFQWVRYSDLIERIGKSVTENKTTAREVHRFSLDGEYIDSWESGTEAGKQLGIQSSKISSVCNGSRNKTGGFKWGFTKDRYLQGGGLASELRKNKV